MCTQRNPIYSECDTEHGIPDPVIFLTPNILTKGSLKENEKMPKSTHDKIREGDQNTNSILKEIRNKIIFWKAIRPFISDKQKIYQKDFILIENENVTSNETEVAGKMNNFFLK